MKPKQDILISEIFIEWYKRNKRDLPWRDINDPYLIWISEIILQQTRVNQGLSYYHRFVKRFPTVALLAEAEEDEVLKCWQGLGYYSRARNLHKAAKQIMNSFDGQFPTEYSEVLSLSGIGNYTASAICSFAFQQAYAVVDGNVFRVLSRFFGIDTPIDSGTGKMIFEKLANEILSVRQPALHNQALMEFGALQCVPYSPDCTNCPLNNRCKALELQLVEKLPVKSTKTKVMKRFFNYFYIQYRGNIFLQKRTAKDVWQNLYEFPLIENEKLLTASEIFINDEFNVLFSGIANVQITKMTNPIKHVLSHRVIHAQFIHVNVSELNENFEKFILVPVQEIDNYPVSRLIELFLENEKKFLFRV